MHYRRLGSTGLKVSELCLGAMTFGPADWGCDEATSKRILDAFFDRGGNFIDTANVYGHGTSEEIVGRSLDKKRSQVVLATKVAAPMGDAPTEGGLSAKHILDAVDDSLRRLRTDYIDLYQVHGYDPSTPMEETLVALDRCVRAGKVRYLGCSNWTAWQIVKANGIARQLGLARFDCLQPRYSLVSREIDREHLPMCREEGIGVIPYSPLGGGLLTGKVSADGTPPDGSRLAIAAQLRGPELFTDRDLAIAKTVAAVAARIGATSGQVALAWVSAQPGVTSPIFGARTMEQLDDNVGSAEVTLDDEAMEELEAVSAITLGAPYDRQIEVRQQLHRFLR